MAVAAVRALTDAVANCTYNQIANRNLACPEGDSEGVADLAVLVGWVKW